MDYRELYKKVVEFICKRKVEPTENIYEPEPPKALVEGRTYVVDDDGLINIRLDESTATEEDYKDFCRFAFEKIGDSLDNYLEEEKRFSNFKKQ